MSKELTEQWRNGTLKEGWYYLLYDIDESDSDCDYWNGYAWHFDYPPAIEVLAPVPSYDEWEELQEASDGLSKTMFKSLMDRFVKADEERERLEEQLKEANEVIENMKLCMDNKYDYDCVAEDVDIYLEKWGLR